LSDLNVKILSGSDVTADGIINYDNVNSSSLFSNDDARFTITGTNSKIRMNPGTVVGWRDRSVIKNITGSGLGDYNLQTYAGADRILTYAEAPGELVYDNSNAIVKLDVTTRTNSNAFARGIRSNSQALTSWVKQTSNTANWLNMRVRTDSNAFARGIKSNSNALTSWAKQTSNTANLLSIRVRTDSNAFLYGIKNNSNALTSWAKQTSNTANLLSIRVRTDSNAFLYGIKNNSNAIIKLNQTVPSGLVTQTSNAVNYLGPIVKANSNAIKFERDHFISVNDGKVTALGAINGSTNVAGRSLLSSPIDLQGGTLTLGSDMILSNQTTVLSSGNFDLQGNSIIFGGDLTLPANVAIKVVSSGVLDGQGNELKLAVGSKLVVDTGITLTLRNLNWLAAGSPQIEMRSATSKLTLQNTALCFDRDYSFTQGQLFIQDDMFVTGTSKFSYASTGTSYIASHSLLYFDKNTTFSYSPRVTARHTLSERNLIKLSDNTSEIYFNECTLQLPDSGWQLTKGSIYFDNKVTVNGGGSITQEKSFELGDGTVAGDMNVQLLSGALLDNLGYIYYNSGN